MARNKRMFSTKIIDSDAFLNLPLSAQALYFHLAMRADDDGFIGNTKRLVGYIGASQKDLKALLDARYLLQINDVIVVKHWKINNYIQKDRYVPTSYRDEYNMLRICDNDAYTDHDENGNKLDTECIQNDNSMDTESYTECTHSCDQNVSSNVNVKERVNVKEKELNTLGDSVEPPVAKKTSLDDFFESIWQLYPLKKGKGQVSDTKKKVLQKVGYEQIKRCVKRYTEYLKQSGKEQYTMHGSTFFNSGYVDYLDENYKQESVDVPEEIKPAETDRFKDLEPDKRAELEVLGIIQGQQLVLGDATEEQVDYLRKVGVL